MNSCHAEPFSPLNNPAPTGFRRLSPESRRALEVAEAFEGLPPGVDSPAALLGAFKAAAPALGLPVRVVHAVDWLFKFTQAQDWGADSRPIVWPSASLQRAELSLSVTAAKRLNADLVELGLVVMIDSPNGKRFGRRDRAGRIIEAYGFDLSPLAVRFAEMQELAAAARAERAERQALNRRKSIARRGIAQVIEAATLAGFAEAPGLDLADLAATAAGIVAELAGEHLPLSYLAAGVEALERHQVEALGWYDNLWKNKEMQKNSDPKGAKYSPHIYLQPIPISIKDTVVASEGCSSGVEGDATPLPPVSAGSGAVPVPGPAVAAPPIGEEAGAEADSLKMAPAEVVDLFPVLVAYLTTASPGWRDIVEAAARLGISLGISRTLWGEACMTLGRERAAIALAIVASKPLSEFKSGPCGYYCGMVKKAKAGDLHLERTLWKHRDAYAKRRGLVGRGGRTLH